MATDHKGIELNQEGDPAPWGNKEETAFKQTIDMADERVEKSEKGQPNGVATLGADGKVPQSQLPIDAIQHNSLSDRGVANAHPISAITDLQTELDTLGDGVLDNASDIADKIDSSEKGVANGVAELDGSGKVPASQIPAFVESGIRVVGSWDALNNTPDIGATTPDDGTAYIVSQAGSTNLGGETNWKVKDLATYFASTGWFKIDNTDDVISVNGQTGVVTLTKSDVGLGSVDNTSDANKPVSTAQQTALDLKLDKADYEKVFVSTVAELQASLLAGNRYIVVTAELIVTAGDTLTVPSGTLDVYLTGSELWLRAGLLVNGSTSNLRVYNDVLLDNGSYDLGATRFRNLYVISGTASNVTVNSRYERLKNGSLGLFFTQDYWDNTNDATSSGNPSVGDANEIQLGDGAGSFLASGLERIIDGTLRMIGFKGLRGGFRSDGDLFMDIDADVSGSDGFYVRKNTGTVGTPIWSNLVEFLTSGKATLPFASVATQTGAKDIMIKEVTDTLYAPIGGGGGAKATLFFGNINFVSGGENLYGGGMSDSGPTKTSWAESGTINKISVFVDNASTVPATVQISVNNGSSYTPVTLTVSGSTAYATGVALAYIAGNKIMVKNDASASTTSIGVYISIE